MLHIEFRSTYTSLKVRIEPTQKSKDGMDQRMQVIWWFELNLRTQRESDNHLLPNPPS